MLLLVYPIFETLFSMYRRKFVQGQSPGQPDRMHLHQLIHTHLMGDRIEDGSDPATTTRRNNNKVAPVCWLISLICALPAVLFWSHTHWLIAASLLFSAAYAVLYGCLLRQRPL